MQVPGGLNSALLVQQNTNPYLVQYEGGINTTVTDSANHYNLTITGGVTSVSDALHFASNGYAQSAGDVPELDGINYMEIEFDLKFASLASAFNVPIARWNYSSDGQFACQFDPSTSTCRFYIATSAGDAGVNYRDFSGLGASTTVFKHFKFVYDGTQSAASGGAARIRLWLDGVEKTGAASGVPATLTSSAAKLTLGQFQGLGRYFLGDLDNVTIKLTRP